MSGLTEDAMIAEANRRWDRANGNPFTAARISPSWKEARLVMRGKLTDKRIHRYAKEGRYSAAYKAALKARWQKKARRQGNYEEVEGRLIYRPV